MCQRYALDATLEELAELFGADCAQTLPPRYNIPPSDLVAVVRARGPGHRELVRMRWGLAPGRDVKLRTLARAETVATMPLFARAFAARRCLLPMRAFYEWQGRDHPYCVRMRSQRLFATAGLWESSRGVDAVAMITTSANAVVGPIHDRMPLIIDRADFAAWLDARTPPEQLLALLKPYPADAMEIYRVSTWVNSPRRDDRRCLEPDLELPLR